MDVSEEEYIAWKKEWGRENSCNHSFQLGSRIVDAYEAEQNKIRPGDWYSVVEGDDYIEFFKCDDQDEADSVNPLPQYHKTPKELMAGLDKVLKTGQGEPYLAKHTAHPESLKDIVQGEG